MSLATGRNDHEKKKFWPRRSLLFQLYTNRRQKKKKILSYILLLFLFLTFFLCVCGGTKGGRCVIRYSFAFFLRCFFCRPGFRNKTASAMGFYEQRHLLPFQEKRKKDGCACFRDRLCVFRFCHCCGRALPMNDMGRDKERANYAMGTIIFFNLRNIKEKDKDLRLSKQEKNQTRRRPRAVVIPSLRSS